MFEIGAGGNWGALSTSHHHTSWGAKAGAPGSRSGDRGCRAGWEPHPEDPDGVSFCPVHPPLKAAGEGCGAARLGLPQLSLTPKNKKLRKDGQALSDSYSKATWIFQGEVTW